MRPYPTTITAALIAAALISITATAQPLSTSDWQQRQAYLQQQRQIQQQLDEQRDQLHRLQAAQRRQAAAAATQPYVPYAPGGTPLPRTPLPNTPLTPRTATTPAAQAYIDRIMADTDLSHGAKLRLVRQTLEATR